MSNQIFFWALLLSIYWNQFSGAFAAKPGLCEVETGQSNIILDIEESKFGSIGQSTTPEELPIIGDPSEIALELTFPKGKPLFILNRKKLHLVAPLDRDVDNISHVIFQLSCSIRATNKKRSIPVIVRVSDVNDQSPVFANQSYKTTVSELTPVGTTIYQGIVAEDKDAGLNGLVEYSLIPTDPKALGLAGSGNDRITVADGYGFFAIKLPHQGQVSVYKSLDYEKTQRYLLTITASDRARNVSERFTATTTLTVNVKDEDDQDPSFIYQGCRLHDGTCINPEYKAYVSSGKLSGVLHVIPEKIQAVDMDSTINALIEYSFLSGSPANYNEAFTIDQQTAAVRQIQTVNISEAVQYDIIVKAREVSEMKRFATAKLTLVVQPVDVSPPMINSSDTHGFVDENVPIGTTVLDAQGFPIKLHVTDADYQAGETLPKYDFEITTNFFRVDPTDNILKVNEENLDRDPPNPGVFRFQIVAREEKGNVASPPVSFTVTINDINDNAPRLPMLPPLTVQAGELSQHLVKVEAMDDDLGENAEITYSIYHVSNNGRQKFKMNPNSGQISTVGKLAAGEQYSITVQATDKGGKSSQTIVEVTVAPGPNTRSPIFEEQVYELQVSEGASINSTVAQITAKDPENEPVTYSILSGNDLRQFGIGEKTGIITVIRKLDREDLTRYQLLVKAEDSDGLFSTARVNIRVTDINDKNPEFQGTPYVFQIREGETNLLIGSVHAEDADEGQNALVYYSLPNDVPFDIDTMTGEIRTKVPLDFEKNREYKIVVTAKDGAADLRIATATVTVQVMDIDDELPKFRMTSYEARVPENVPDHIVMRVKAEDPDTNPKVTYIIKQGPSDLFTIDPKTGVIRTVRGLDYERENQYILMVGTLENPGFEPGATTRVIIDVEDRNDIPPVFTTVPQPVSIVDDVPVGTPVTSLIATDSDGTSPGNKVLYELVGRGKATKYFQIDPDTATISIKDDLRRETTTEYELDVKAYDLGEPRLSSIATLAVFVRHVATTAPEHGVGFAEDLYSVEINENLKPGSLVKALSIITQGPRLDKPITLNCNIITGNEEDIFLSNVTNEYQCEIRLRQGKYLDYEIRDSYELEVILEMPMSWANQRGRTRLKINVRDVNDNSPVFIFHGGQSVRGKYLAAITLDALIGTPVLQIKAEDKDSGKNGQIFYSLLGNQSDLLSIDGSGLIRTKKSFSDLENELLPFRLTIEARDNPDKPLNESHKTSVPLVINVVTNLNRMVLVIDDARPDTIKPHEDDIIRVLEEHSGLAICIENLDIKHVQGANRSIETNSKGTDVIFYAIDPTTDLILPRTDLRVFNSILEVVAASKITYDIRGNIRAQALEIRPPIEEHRTVIPAATSLEVFPFALIAIACIILVLGLIGIVYICISWSKYKSYKEHVQRMYVVPRYDPVLVEPSNLKEYETQVLQMSVPLDDSDSYDLQLDFSSKNHAFSLDNVSYITKENGQKSPVSSEAATTARTSSLPGSLDQSQDEKNTSMNNIKYQRSEEDLRAINASSTNENVTFREKKDYSHLGFTYLGETSPVETTTEL